MFVNVNGIELYYEKVGQGESVILLHGNGEDHTIFDVLTERLSAEHTVYAIDSRDHGKSGRVKELDYGTMAEDVAAFIRELDIRNAVVYGFSDGGIIGLLLAIKYPMALSKLIISGANTQPDGIKKRFIIQMQIIYFFTRSRKYRLMLTQPNITEAELNTITAPTLVLAGSGDIVRGDHTESIAKSIPGSVLRILDGEGHASYVVHSEKLYGVIAPFLRGAG